MSLARCDRSVRALIFDLDGVLIASRSSHCQAFCEILAEFQITEFDYSRFAGWRTPEVFRQVLAPLSPSEAVIADCSARKSARARELLSSDTVIASDCVPVLKQLSQRYRLALASSGSRASVLSFLERTATTPLFASVLTGDDVTHAKPDPEIFSRSIVALSLPAAECGVIEDAVAGVKAALGAGARAIGFGKEHAGELRTAGAEFVVDSMTELAEVL